MSKFESSESAFNFAVEYLKSIKISLDAGKICAIRGDMDGWCRWVRSAYREISLMTDPKEDEDFEKDFRAINTLINNPSDRVHKRREILLLLDKLEIKIRKTMQKKGMVLPRKSDPRYAVLER